MIYLDEQLGRNGTTQFFAKLSNIDSLAHVLIEKDGALYRAEMADSGVTEQFSEKEYEPIKIADPFGLSMTDMTTFPNAQKQTKHRGRSFRANFYFLPLRYNEETHLVTLLVIRGCVWTGGKGDKVAAYDTFVTEWLVGDNDIHAQIDMCALKLEQLLSVLEYNDKGDTPINITEIETGNEKLPGYISDANYKLLKERREEALMFHDEDTAEAISKVLDENTAKCELRIVKGKYPKILNIDMGLRNGKTKGTLASEPFLVDMKCYTLESHIRLPLSASLILVDLNQYMERLINDRGYTPQQAWQHFLLRATRHRSVNALYYKLTVDSLKKMCKWSNGQFLDYLDGYSLVFLDYDDVQENLSELVRLLLSHRTVQEVDNLFAQTLFPYAGIKKQNARLSDAPYTRFRVGIDKVEKLKDLYKFYSRHLVFYTKPIKGKYEEFKLLCQCQGVWREDSLFYDFDGLETEEVEISVANMREAIDQLHKVLEHQREGVLKATGE